MEGTRLRILQLLQRNINDTVDGLAGAVGLAPATIRRHLDILQRDKLVAFEEVRKRTGRPEYSFYLTEEGQETLPKNYDLLLNMLIRELGAMPVEDTSGLDGEQILELAFRQMSARLWADHRDEVRGKDLEYRLASLTKLLEHHDFFPEAEVEGQTLRIRLLNCPFRSVALSNKAVCSFDANVISDMLDVDVSRQSCIHDGDAGCTYTASIDAGQAEELSGVGQL